MKQGSNEGLAGDWRHQLCGSKWLDDLPHFRKLVYQTERERTYKTGSQGFGEEINFICNEFYDDVGNHTFALLEEAVC